MNCYGHISLSTSPVIFFFPWDRFLRVKSLCQGHTQFKRSSYVMPESFAELLSIYILVGCLENSHLTTHCPTWVPRIRVLVLKRKKKKNCSYISHPSSPSDYTGLHCHNTASQEKWHWHNNANWKARTVHPFTIHLAVLARDSTQFDPLYRFLLFSHTRCRAALSP